MYSQYYPQGLNLKTKLELDSDKMHKEIVNCGYQCIGPSKSHPSPLGWEIRDASTLDLAWASSNHCCRWLLCWLLVPIKFCSLTVLVPETSIYGCIYIEKCRVYSVHVYKTSIKISLIDLDKNHSFITINWNLIRIVNNFIEFNILHSGWCIHYKTKKVVSYMFLCAV